MGSIVSSEVILDKDVLTTSLSIYVLELQKGKYYVGRTENMDNRYQQHLNGKGSEWTKLYKPIKILKEYKNASPYDEDKTVIEYMDKFGIENVRGGIYSKINLNKDDIDNIKKQIWSANDKCFNCGGDHFAKYCVSQKSNHNAYMKSEVTKVIKYESVENLTKPQDIELYNKITDWRFFKSKEIVLSEHYILKDNIIKDLSYYKPKDYNELKMIKGIADIKADQYGEDLLNIINKIDEFPVFVKSYKNKEKYNKYDSITELTTSKDIELYNKLVDWRLSKSKELGLSITFIMKDETIKDIAYYKPRNHEDFKKIKGLGDKKCESYGDDIIKIVYNKYENILILTDENDIILYHYLKKYIPKNYSLKDSILKDLSHYKPKNMIELKMIKGVGKVISENYGKFLLDLINDINSNIIVDKLQYIDDIIFNKLKELKLFK